MQKLLILIFMTATLDLSAQEHKVGIVLSGGGALGYAHIGALQALEDNGIFPTIIAGASIGGLIGAFYASGYSPSQIREFVKFENFNNPLKVITPLIKHRQLGFFSQKNILNILEKYIPHNSFEGLKFPLFVSVTNLTRGKVEYASSGELFPCLLASSAIPTIFEAVKINSMTYVDGGTLNNMPAQPIREKCKFLIGIDVKSDYNFSRQKRIKDILMRTLNVVIMQNSIEGRKLCDVLIEPQSNQKYNDFSFSAFDKIYKEGYNVTQQYLDQNPEMTEKLKETFNRQ
jgi:NTE family protein